MGSEEARGPSVTPKYPGLRDLEQVAASVSFGSIFGGFLSLDWLSGSILEDFHPSISQKKVFSFVRPRSRA